jgi:hypothetical protein
MYDHITEDEMEVSAANPADPTRRVGFGSAVISVVYVGF